MIVLSEVVNTILEPCRIIPHFHQLKYFRHLLASESKNFTWVNINLSHLYAEVRTSGKAFKIYSKTNTCFALIFCSTVKNMQKFHTI